MEKKSAIERFYFTPIWVINALGFGEIAIENYQTYSQQGENLESLIFWGAGTVVASCLALICVNDGIDKINELYSKYIAKKDYR